MSDLGTGAGTAARVLVELVSAIAVGGFLGYWIDRWLGSAPWAMLVLVMLGFVAGIINVRRIAARAEEQSTKENS